MAEKKHFVNKRRAPIRRRLQISAGSIERFVEEAAKSAIAGFQQRLKGIYFGRDQRTERQPYRQLPLLAARADS